MIRGVRGAITVEENNETVIVSATERMMRELILQNDVNAEDVASVFISVTDDLNDVFPARALRQIDGWRHVPVMCMKEIPVKNSLKMCIRVMVHVNTSKSQKEINHIYLERAISLRPDLQS